MRYWQTKAQVPIAGTDSTLRALVYLLLRFCVLLFLCLCFLWMFRLFVYFVFLPWLSVVEARCCCAAASCEQWKHRSLRRLGILLHLWHVLSGQKLAHLARAFILSVCLSTLVLLVLVRACTVCMTLVLEAQPDLSGADCKQAAADLLQSNDLGAAIDAAQQA